MRKVQLCWGLLFTQCPCLLQVLPLLQVLLGKCNSFLKGNIYPPRCLPVIETEADKLNQEICNNYSVFQHVLTMTQLLKQFIIVVATSLFHMKQSNLTRIITKCLVMWIRLFGVSSRGERPVREDWDGLGRVFRWVILLLGLGDGKGLKGRENVFLCAKVGKGQECRVLCGQWETSPIRAKYIWA